MQVENYILNKNNIKVIITPPKKESNSNFCNSWVVKWRYQYLFICNKCQNISILDNKSSNFRCNVCKNDSFIFDHSILKKSNLLYIKAFNVGFETYINNEYWQVIAYIYYPKVIFDNIVFNKIEFAKLTLTKEGKASFKVFSNKNIKINKVLYNNEIYNFNNYIHNLLSNKLVNLAINSGSISWLSSCQKFKQKSADTKLKIVQFFLKRPYLKDIDFFYWKNFDSFYKHYIEYKEPYSSKNKVINILNFILDYKKSKSIKKALYRGYETSIKNEMYNPYVDYIFNLYFEDINYLKELISIEPTIKNYIFSDAQFIEVLFIIFKNNEKKIKDYFISISYNHLINKILSDTYNMLKKDNLYKYIVEQNIKLPSNPIKLHDEVVKIYNKVSHAKLNNKIFSYEPFKLKSEVTFKNLTFKLPKNKLELLNYGTILSNCVYSYSEDIENGNSTIFFVFKDNLLLYAVEIVDNSIIQALGKYNREINGNDLSIINQWLSKIYLKNRLESLTNNS